MKAWFVFPKDDYYYDTVFAETRGKARAKARYCDGFENCEFVDIGVRRLPQADKLYKGQFGLDWYNDEDRLFLIKECGWSCGYEYFDSSECEYCSGRDFCSQYKEYLADCDEELTC